MAMRTITAALARLPAFLSAIFERPAGGLEAEEGRAAGTVQTFAVISVGTTFVFTVAYLMRPDQTTGPLVLLSTGTLIAFIANLVVVRSGRQLVGAIMYLTIATVGMLYMAQLFGWRTGQHLYLITSAQLVFLMFTDRQRGWRSVFVVGSAAAFIYTQLGAPPVGPYSQASDATISTIFAVNAIGTATLMFILSVVAHYRAGAAQARAAELAAQAEYLANTDPLTGLANRRPISARLEALASLDGARYCVAIADIDRFKALNDAHGHACGDRVLAALGARLRGQLRTTDALGRWGGEEFIVVLADTGIDEAGGIMERMRSLVAGSPVECGEHVHAVTMSVGVADGVADSMSHRVVKRADDALYDAKLAGRDRVQVRALGEPDSVHPAARRGR